jgi:hypothetical protein
MEKNCVTHKTHKMRYKKLRLERIRARLAGSDESQSIVSEQLSQTSKSERHTYTKDWVQQKNTRAAIYSSSARTVQLEDRSDPSFHPRAGMKSLNFTSAKFPQEKPHQSRVQNFTNFRDGIPDAGAARTTGPQSSTQFPNAH